MKNLSFSLLLAMFFSCTKQDSKLSSPTGVEFFGSEAKMTAEVTAIIGNDFGDLKNFYIKKVNYYEDKEKSLAHITYVANGKEYSNIVFVITAQKKTSFKCTTTNCQCRLDIYSDGQGQYIYECGGCNTDCHLEVTQE